MSTKPDGIGLAVCRSIVEAHEGSIRIEPNAGPGVTAVFSLARAAQAWDEHK